MKTMKSLIVALALVTGLVGIAKAGGKQGNGWNVTIVTGTAVDIGGGQRTYLKKIILSSGTTTSFGEWLQAFSSAPSVSQGAGNSLMPNHLYVSTRAVTPPIVFATTTSVSGLGASLNNVWYAGDGEDDYIEIPGTSGDQSRGLHIRKSAETSGGANQAAVYWSY